MNNGAVITLTRDATTATAFTGTYTVAGDDGETSYLAVSSYTAGTAVDLVGNGLVAGVELRYQYSNVMVMVILIQPLIQVGLDMLARLILIIQPQR